jgi:hypothetical protein
MTASRPIWDYPPEYQARCRVIAGSAWILLGAGFYYVLVGSWGHLSGSIIVWALGAVPTAYLMLRWLLHYGAGRSTAAAFLLACCIALTAAAIVLYDPLVQWKHRLPYIVLWFPVGLSACGAILGFVGRATARRGSA